MFPVFAAQSLMNHRPQALTWRLNGIGCCVSWTWLLMPIDWVPQKIWYTGMPMNCLWNSWRAVLKGWKRFFVLHQRGCDLENCESTNDFVQLQLNKGIISLLLEALELALLEASLFFLNHKCSLKAAVLRLGFATFLDPQMQLRSHQPFGR